MRRRKAVLLGLGAGAAAAVVGFLFLPPVRDRIVEEWLLGRLDSKDPAVVRRAAERLAVMGSVRAIPRLVRMADDGCSSSDNQSLVKWLIVIGPPGVEAAFRTFRTTEGKIDILSAIEEMGPAAKIAMPHMIPFLAEDEVNVFAGRAIAAIGADAIPLLVKALAKGKPEIREGAAFALGYLGNEAAPAVPALARALADRSDDVRLAAATTLRDIGPAAREAVPALIRALGDWHEGVQQEATDALGEIGPAAGDAIPALIDSLERLQGHAGEALAKIDPEGKVVVPRLAAEIEGRTRKKWPAMVFFDVFLRYQGGSEAAREAVIGGLDSPDPDVRAAAVRNAGSLPPEKCVPKLLRLLDGDSPGLRLVAAESLAEMGRLPDGRLDILIEGLEDPEADVREDAAWAIARLGPKAKPAADALIAALSDDDLARPAAKALGAIGEGLRDRVDEIAKLLEKPGTRLKAVEVLGRLGPVADGTVEALVRAMRIDPQNGTADDLAFALAAIDALGRIGSRAAVAGPVLVSMLGIHRSYAAESETPSHHAEKALLAIGEPAREAVHQGLGSPDAGVRSGCARVLGGIAVGSSGAGSAEVAAALKQLLADKDSGVRATAARAYWAVTKDAGSVLPVIIPLLLDVDDAFWALEDIGPAAAPAVPALISILADDRHDLDRVLDVLRAIGPAGRAAIPVLEEMERSPFRRSHREAIAAALAAIRG